MPQISGIIRGARPILNASIDQKPSRISEIPTQATTIGELTRPTAPEEDSRKMETASLSALGRLVANVRSCVYKEVILPLHHLRWAAPRDHLCRCGRAGSL